MNLFQSLTVKAKFSAGDQAMVVYEVDMPGIASDFLSAALLNFRDGLIDQLLMDRLPRILNSSQKKNRIGNLISKMKMAGLVRNAGSDKLPNWVRSSPNSLTQKFKTRRAIKSKKEQV